MRVDAAAVRRELVGWVVGCVVRLTGGDRGGDESVRSNVSGTLRENKG